ncbi:MAG: SIS domain-containing protein [Planctomycetota bacterium]|jgi:D-sedoheptulose 7-phosphate isomerase
MNADTEKHIAEAVETHRKMTAEFEQGGFETVAVVAEAITETLRQDGTVYLCGNGGSAADAQHIPAHSRGTGRQIPQGA